MDCIFCDIVAGKIPSKIIYQDSNLVAFRDIKPQAPNHILIVPRQHIAALNEITDEQSDLMGRLIVVACQLARQESLDSTGYRLVINCGPQGGQIIPHLHLHLLGGRQLSSEMG